MKTIIWLLAASLVIGVPLSLPASEDERESDNSVSLTPEQIKVAGIVTEVLQLQQLTAEILAPG